jgi:carboxyl-terminal processing protease
MTTYETPMYGVIKLAQFGSGAHAEVYAAIRKVRERGAKGIVFDLRGNGGARVRGPAHRERLHRRGPDRHDEGPQSSRPHAARPRATPCQGRPARGARGRGHRVGSEIVAGALQDTKRPRWSGTKTFGKGVFQEVIELSNGGALDITAGQYFTPKGRNLGGKGVSTGAGIRPTWRPRTIRRPSATRPCPSP